MSWMRECVSVCVSGCESSFEPRLESLARKGVWVGACKRVRALARDWRDTVHSFLRRKKSNDHGEKRICAFVLSHKKIVGGGLLTVEPMRKTATVHHRASSSTGSASRVYVWWLLSNVHCIRLQLWMLRGSAIGS
jgi:hypothetical protein